MAWRPSEWVLGGELDNTIFGWTKGWLEIVGEEKGDAAQKGGNELRPLLFALLFAS